MTMDKWMYSIFVIGLTAMFHVDITSSEVYSSMSDIKKLMMIMADIMRQDILILEKVKKKDATINSLVAQIRGLMAGISDPDFTPHHPINAYRFIQNVTSAYNESTFKLFQDLRQTHLEKTEMGRIKRVLPTREDITGALEGILRLQYTYDLKASDIANGNCNGIISKQNLTAVDALELMLIAYEKYPTSWMPLQWQTVAIDTVSKGDTSTTIVDIYSKAAERLQKLNYAADATKLYRKIMDIEPNTKRHRMKWTKSKEQISPESKQWRMTPKKHLLAKHDLLCQGKNIEKFLQNKAPKGNLVCKTVHNHHPLLLLNPIKMSQVSLQPYIVEYYDFMSNSDILSLKSNARPKIANYGIGGHYSIHEDFFPPQKSDNRIATFMIYLSSVESGGATVFPLIGEALFPEKGKAVFWYNLYRNGTGIIDTRHAACPVLAGDKWVANYWIRRNGQEFTKPCSLNQFNAKWP